MSWFWKGCLWVIGFNAAHLFMEHVVEVREPVAYSLMGCGLGILLCEILGD